MSVTIDSTNPRIIADNIRKLDDAVQSAVELPEVETTDEGKVLTVNSSGKWAALDLPSSIPKDYSLTETDTGLKWIDGKNVYQKILSGVTATEGSVTIPLDFDNIIDLGGIVMSTAGVYAPAVHLLQMYGNAAKTGLVIPATSSALYQGTNYYIIIYYTKPAETREPDDAPDAEPELKKVTKKKTTKKEEE